MPALKALAPTDATSAILQLRDALERRPDSEGDRYERLGAIIQDAAHRVLRHSTDDDARRTAHDALDAIELEHLGRDVREVLDTTRDVIDPRQERYLTRELEDRVIARMHAARQNRRRAG